MQPESAPTSSFSACLVVAVVPLASLHVTSVAPRPLESTTSGPSVTTRTVLSPPKTRVATPSPVDTCVAECSTRRSISVVSPTAAIPSSRHRIGSLANRMISALSALQSQCLPLPVSFSLVAISCMSPALVNASTCAGRGSAFPSTSSTAVCVAFPCRIRRLRKSSPPSPASSISSAAKHTRGSTSTNFSKRPSSNPAASSRALSWSSHSRATCTTSALSVRHPSSAVRRGAPRRSCRTRPSSCAIHALTLAPSQTAPNTEKTFSPSNANTAALSPPSTAAQTSATCATSATV
mmetsp:Transcript_68602/g.161279  ORF Transcript_68602/g.161279 Transcript_68602/m.161279 type:complete len:293 (+) Transcript_68602:832-1710(+)